MPQHLSFSLLPKEPFSLRYFVVHSGVSDAYATLDQAAKIIIKKPSFFQVVFLSGPSGSGKTHLAHGYADKLIEQGATRTSIRVQDLIIPLSDSLVSEIVAKYEELKRTGGIIIFTSRQNAQETTTNPHLQSRLLAGSIAALNYPKEDELKPLLLSLLERRNLILSETSLEYLLKRLPVDPLSFDNIFARLNEQSLSEGKAPGQKMIRNILKSE